MATSSQSASFVSQLLSLTLDGLTGVSQDHMRAHYQTGSNHMMLNVNLWSTLLLGAGKWHHADLPVGHGGRQAVQAQLPPPPLRVLTLPRPRLS